MSIAPVAKSQLSKCPPITIFSFGKVLPFKVATTLRALIKPEKLVILIRLYNLPVANCSFNKIPSSLPTQTAGIGINFPVTEAVPVRSTPLGGVLITIIPFAPYLVAMAVFSERCKPGVPGLEPGKTPKYTKAILPFTLLGLAA